MKKLLISTMATIVWAPMAALVLVLAVIGGAFVFLTAALIPLVHYLARLGDVE